MPKNTKATQKKILVIDDDMAITEALNLALTAFDFSVLSATKSSEVLPAVKKFKPDLIILDYFLAGEDGTEIALRMKNLKIGVKIIMFSAHPSAKEVVDKIKVDAFVSKPFDINSLVRKINRLLS